MAEEIGLSKVVIHTEGLSEKQREIIEALKLGVTRRAAADYAGVGKSTFYRWLEAHEDFADAVRQAEAVAEVGHTAVIGKAAQAGDWRASLEWLKRRRRAEWGDRINLRDIPDDTLLRLLERAEEAETDYLAEV